METTRLKISIVEDNHAIRNNLAEMIRHDNGFSLIGEFSNAEDALETIPHIEPDLVIMDIELPGMTGIECVRKLKTTCRKTQFMMFTVFEESDQVFQALSAGANGYVLKTAGEEEILNSLKELHDGGSPMSPLIARKVVNTFRKDQPTASGDHALSSRELEILTLLSQGMLYKEISDELGITLGTVKQHLHRIYDKLHVNNKTEAINRVFRDRN